MAERSRAAERPQISCEITGNSVVAARTRDRMSVEAVHSRSLPSGAVTPSLLGPNIHNQDAVRDAIADVLAAIGAKNCDLVAVVPDVTVRVLLLDFESFPTKREDAEPVVRFRLKKSLPFDVDKAAVSYHALPSSTGPTRVLTAVMLRTVLDEFEAVYRAAGCEPGVVLPSGLAALGAMQASSPTMLLKLDPTTVSVAIVEDEQVYLFRTLEAASEPDASRIAEDIYPSLVYFQDAHGRSVNRLVVAGPPKLLELSSVLAEQNGLRVEEFTKIDVMARAGARSDAAGAIGALL